MVLNVSTKPGFHDTRRQAALSRGNMLSENMRIRIISPVLSAESNRLVLEQSRHPQTQGIFNRSQSGLAQTTSATYRKGRQDLHSRMSRTWCRDTISWRWFRSCWCSIYRKT